MKRRKNHLFGIVVFSLLIIIIALLVVFLVKLSAVKKGTDTGSTGSTQSAVSASSQAAESTASKTASSRPKTVTRGDVTLDAEYSVLTLVNAENLLPEDFDYEKDLTTIPDQYHNGQLKQINKNVWPYMKAMIDAAWSDGVDLKVWSPFRSYDTQNMLYENQVKRCMNKGMDRTAAEAEAATVVARPGTSEHNTGLAADFNMASDTFETTPMFTWMKQHAADYGFIMRYAKDKQPKTGVIYESWHWRFVGIYTAKEINDSGLCLEEYVAKQSDSSSQAK